jgi:hypothetical protein
LSTQKPLNLWNYKPWWCQPWSIILTGMAMIATSWATFQSLWLTIPISLAIIVWWTYFLIILPKLLQHSQILENKQQPTKDSLSLVIDESEST